MAATSSAMVTAQHTGNGGDHGAMVGGTGWRGCSTLAVPRRIKVGDGSPAQRHAGPERVRHGRGNRLGAQCMATRHGPRDGIDDHVVHGEAVVVIWSPA
jgi:hypothetical protein